jgi:hypothetical protein
VAQAALKSNWGKAGIFGTKADKKMNFPLQGRIDRLDDDGAGTAA